MILREHWYVQFFKTNFHEMVPKSLQPPPLPLLVHQHNQFNFIQIYYLNSSRNHYFNCFMNWSFSAYISFSSLSDNIDKFNVTIYNHGNNNNNNDFLNIRNKHSLDN